MTLIAVYNSDGCVGRCDARCYQATTPTCHCICGGKNHAAGLVKALDNTREMAKDWLENAADKLDDRLYAELHDEVSQPSLPFPEECNAAKGGAA